MMKRIMVALLFIAVMASVAALQLGRGTTPAYADGEGESLSIYMDQMRRLTHKLGLSVDAQNPALAKFYLRETGEMVTFIKKKFPEYDGFQVGALATAMLDPYLVPLTKAVDAGDWKAASSAYDTLLSSGCNGCHTATQHAFVKIVRSTSNPYNQDFKP